MAEGYPHGAIPQLPALRRRHLVHLGTVFLHDQRAGRLFFRDFSAELHGLFIASERSDVNPAGHRLCRSQTDHSPLAV
jgi:hypothetical protein